MLLSSQITQTDVGIIAIVCVIVIVLGYRLLRREPEARIVRIGIFIERQRYDPVTKEAVTEEFKWPRPPE